MTSVRELCFNRNTRNWFKNARNLLQRGHLSKKDLVFLCYLINNKISRYRSINYQLCSVPDLITFLRTNKDHFRAIVYCRRIVTEDIFCNVTSCNYRIEFLKQCINNDIIPEFLRFRAFLKEHFL